MTHIINIRNVNEGLAEAFWHLKIRGIKETSRNGDVIVSPGPVVTTYSNPVERVLFNPERDANPVFHLLESIWMLAGANDSKWIIPFNARFSEYAEPDGRVNGAYGHRWRKHFGIDQIERVVETLSVTPNSRQAVIQMWDPSFDGGQPRKDIPCNTAIYFDLRGGVLNMTVTNRSNDVVWGAYGANAVHMSVLQELIAAALGVNVGEYRQFSNNFHAYTSLPQVEKWVNYPPGADTRYEEGKVRVQPLVGAGEDWRSVLYDAEQMISFPPDFQVRSFYRTRFFNDIAEPLRWMYTQRKAGVGIQSTLSALPTDNDWCVAFKEWVERRDGSQ